MLSYHNDPAVKQKYISRFEAHRAADEVIQGIGFENGRGCFVGCTLDKYDHTQFPIELGWPEWLARLADSIFEGIPKVEAPQFGSDLLAAVPVGVGLEPVRHHLAIRRLNRLLNIQQDLAEKHPQLNEVFGQVTSAITTVIRCHEAEIGATSCALPDWTAAESAARSAESAESAARSAESAESAESAAWSAARSAESAAFQQERDDLLDILGSLEKPLED